MTSKTDHAGLTRRSLMRKTAALAAAGAYATPVWGRTAMMPLQFDRERFAADCVAAHQADGMPAVREVLTEAVRDHRAVLAGLGEPSAAGLDVLYRSDTFTIFAAHWTPRMNLLPHDHMMEALIGIYTGREDNILWERGEQGLEAVDATCLFEGDVVALDAAAIHSVTNPLRRFTGGIHIYDGDFFATHRHQWDPETLVEEPSDGDAIRELFASENAYYRGLPRN